MLVSRPTRLGTFAELPRLPLLDLDSLPGGRALFDVLTKETGLGFRV